MKTTSLSVRVDDDDAAFLAGLSIEDAHTPSEKLRALLHAERRRQEGIGDPVDASDMFRDLLRPGKRRARRLETDAEIRSDFVTKLYERLPDIVGIAFAGPKDLPDDQARALMKFEKGMLDEIFALMQEVLEMGLTVRSRCYDPSAVASRLEPLIEILDLIKTAHEKRKGSE